MKQVLFFTIFLCLFFDCFGKDWTFYNKNLEQPTRQLQLPLKVEFFGTMRNDAAWNSRTYIPGFVTDLSAWVPIDEDNALDALYIFEPGVAAQRPLASIVNIAPLIGVNIEGPECGRFKYRGYIDCEFLPFGTYFTTEWVVPSTRTLFNTKMLINWAFIEGTLEPRHHMTDYCHSLILGLYNHPLVPTITFPRIVGYSLSAPIVPFAISPQIKYGISCNGWTTKFTFFTEALYQDAGFEDIFVSTLYARRALVPQLNITTEFANDTLILGAGFNFQRIIPRITIEPPTTVNAPTLATQNESLISLAGQLYGMNDIGSFRFKWQGILGQNGFSWGQVMGYFVTQQDNNGGFSYKNILFASIWGDLESKYPLYGCFQPGIFIGYLGKLKNPSPVGVNCQCQPILPETEVSGYFYNIGTGYQTIFKISPRCWWYYNQNLHVGLEFEFTATTSADINHAGLKTNETQAQLIRLVASAQYNF